MNETPKLKNIIFAVTAALLAASLALGFTLSSSVSTYAQNTNNATATTATSITLGEPFYVENGKITGPATYSANGTIMSNGTTPINVTNSGMILTLPIDNNGTLYAQGQGVLTTDDGEMATYTFQFIGQLSEGGIPPHGSWYLLTNSTGSLAFVDNKVGVTRSEIGPNGEFSTKVWEWK